MHATLVISGSCRVAERATIIQFRILTINKPMPLELFAALLLRNYV
jgi:hypothetical protein